MRGFPKTINTREDLYNCYELVKAGELQKEDLLTAIEAIENRNFIFCPVVSIDDTKKVVTIHYCAEAAAGQKMNNAGTLYNISTVEHVEDTEAAGENKGYSETKITVTKAISSIADCVGIPAPVSVYDDLGVTEAEVETMKGGLA